MSRSRRLSAVRLALAACSAVIACAFPAAASAHGRHGRDWSGRIFSSRVFASGAGIMHPIPGGQEPISQPDDITYYGGRIYVTFQNGVGPQGQASGSGATSSTIVAFDLDGHPVRTWEVTGHCDGLTADPDLGQIIATVNEDANASIYLLHPHGGQTHYTLGAPLAHNGGLDAISIYRGTVLISASAPGTTGTQPAPQPTFPAVYETTFDPQTDIATVTPLFYDEDPATVANVQDPGFGQTVGLALTDPDSNEDVPWYARRFAGDFMLTSQGDEEQIFVANAGTPEQHLSVLGLPASVDDTAWPSDPRGMLYTTDGSDDSIYAINGPFRPGQVFVAVTPCDENSAPATCPAPGFPPNYLGRLDPFTGQITPVQLAGPAPQPKGMLFLPQWDLRSVGPRGRPGGSGW